jgi:hypothetical protein
MRNSVTGLAVSLALQPDGLLALHQQGRLLLSFHLLGRPKETSNMTTWLTANYHGRTYTGKICSIMGCERINTDKLK